MYSTAFLQRRFPSHKQDMAEFTISKKDVHKKFKSHWYAMDLNPLDPDDRLRGRPPGRTKKVMNVSLANDVYKALMKIPEGKRSEFISDMLRPTTSQFDPGPSSELALTLKRVLDSAISESRTKSDYEKLTAVSTLADEIMPKLDPFIALCQETEGKESPQRDIPQAIEIETIVSGIRAARTLRRLQSVLRNAEIVHSAVPQRFRDESYEKNLEKTRVALAAVSNLIARYAEYLTDEQAFKDVEGPGKSNMHSHIMPERQDFRRGLPMHDILEGCNKGFEDAGEIPERELQKFISDTCTFVENSVKRSWGSGIELEMQFYAVHPEKKTFLVTLFNSGHYDISIHLVKCDGVVTIFHDAYEERPLHIPVLENATIEVYPCVSILEREEHRITFEVEYNKFSFTVKGTSLPLF